MKVKEESEEASLKFTIQKTKIMPSCPITSRQKWGKNGNSDSLFSWAPKITVDGDYNHEIKIHLLLGRKAITNLDSILKSRHYFADKGPYSQSCGFSGNHVQM